MPCACGRANGHRVLHPARRHGGRNDRHGRQGRRARYSRDSDWRSPPSRKPISAAWEPRPSKAAPTLAPVGHAFAEHGLGATHDPRDRYKPSDCRIGSSSAIYLDGVYLARPAMAFVRFLDLDRIEVLRGPQGTLYGRNAVGGAMNLIPARPPTTSRRPPIPPPETSESCARTRG